AKPIVLPSTSVAVADARNAPSMAEEYSASKSPFSFPDGSASRINGAAPGDRTSIRTVASSSGRYLSSRMRTDKRDSEEPGSNLGSLNPHGFGHTGADPRANLPQLLIETPIDGVLPNRPPPHVRDQEGGGTTAAVWLRRQRRESRTLISRRHCQHAGTWFD